MQSISSLMAKVSELEVQLGQKEEELKGDIGTALMSYLCRRLRLHSIALKTSLKYTRTKELEIEVETLLEESTRLRRALESSRAGAALSTRPPPAEVRGGADGDGDGDGGDPASLSAEVELLRTQLAALKLENVELMREKQQDAKSLDLLRQLRQSLAETEVRHRVCLRLSRYAMLRGCAGFRARVWTWDFLGSA